MARDDRPICFCQPDDTEEKRDDEYKRYDGHVIEGELDAHLVGRRRRSSVSVVEDRAAPECADDAREGAEPRAGCGARATCPRFRRRRARA